jgi:DNA-binding PadR family transcriptional regulator
MRRGEAVALLKELGAEGLIQPSWVLIEQRRPEKYQLCVKGDYDLHQIELFLEKYTLAIEEDKTKGFLCIFKP